MKTRTQLKQTELIGSMREALAHARGELPLKTTKFPRPPPILSPAAITRLRRRLKASVPVFAAYLNVTTETVRSWERDRRQPSGPALRLLQIAKKTGGLHGLLSASLMVKSRRAE